MFAGLIAGAVFMMAEMGLVALAGDSPWGPPRMIAAMVLGPSVLPPPASFDLVVLMTAMMVHFPLSILLAVVATPILARTSLLPALAAGTAFGLLVYVVNFYGFSIIWPWFEMARNVISIASHAMFGLVLALSLKLLTQDK